MCVKNRKKTVHSIPNPTMRNDFDYPLRETNAPFLRNIETTDQRRVYTFQPESDSKFQIVVDFPINNYGDIKVQVAGEQIKTDELIEATLFVQKNEWRFLEAFEESIPREKRQLEIDDQTFQSFQIEATEQTATKFNS